MGNDGSAQGVEHPSHLSIKVHSLMCLQLKKFVDSISGIYSAIESARPRCASGVQALCSLVYTIEKAKLLFLHCSDCSKLYLAFTGERILLRCKNIQNDLDLCLGRIQSMVPTLLAAKISGIIEDLRHVKFHLESSEEEAGNAIIALIRQDIPASVCMNNSELEAFQLAALRLQITSPLAVLVERRSIIRLLHKVHDTNPRKKKILKYLFYLLKKYEALIGQDEMKNNLCSPKLLKYQSTNPEPLVDWDEVNPQADGVVEPPEEFKCPISNRLMYDPVVIASGKTYERVWIEKWFNEGHETCPTTHMRLENLFLTPNFAMQGLISRWCLKHGISVTDPRAQSILAPVSSQNSFSPRSVASVGSSMDDFHLQVSSVSLRTSSTNCKSRFFTADGGSNGNDDLSVELPEMSTVIPMPRSSGSRGYMSLASFAKLASRPWESQHKAMQQVKEQLNRNEQPCDWMFSNKYVKLLTKFLKDAKDLCDVEAQKDSAEVLLAMLSRDGIETLFFDKDSIFALASFLDSEITDKALQIMEALSCHQIYTSEIVASGVLPSILKVLDTQIREFHELAMKMLSNLSCNSDIAYHIVYMDCIPKLVPFLRDSSFAGYCLAVMKNLCHIEEGRNAVADADSCITSIAKLLETGTEREQETSLEVLLSLCHEQLECCEQVIGESTIQRLHNISDNSNSRGKVIAMELLQLLGHVIEGPVSDFSCPPSDGLSMDVSSDSGNQRKGKKSASSIFGYLGRKICRFPH